MGCDENKDIRHSRPSEVLVLEQGLDAGKEHG